MTHAAEFQSTRPVRGATSISARAVWPWYFNPRAPYGARPDNSADALSVTQYFNPRAPYGARRETAVTSAEPTDFNPRAPYGARLPADTAAASKH